MALAPISPEPKKKGGKLVVVEKAIDAGWLQTIERLAPTIGIEGVRELMTMRREEQSLLAEREFNAAMSEAQAALKPVTRNLKNKQTGSNYADLAAIAETAMPIIHDHGFSVICSEFKSERPDYVGIACKVAHRAGHSERYEFNIPIDGTGMKGNPNKTATHAYSSTVTYGRRYAKCCVFDIATKDDDGNAAGGGASSRIGDDDLKEINRLISKTKANVPAFCTIFGAEMIEDIPASEAKTAIRMLKLKAGEAQ